MFKKTTYVTTYDNIILNDNIVICTAINENSVLCYINQLNNFKTTKKINIFVV